MDGRRSLLYGKVNFPLMLAPMVGLSHGALRAVLRTYLPRGARTFWPTEMLNSRRLPSETLGETPETACMGPEPDLVPQILGNEEESIAASVRKLEAWGISAVDINMGCPVQKALKHNYGVALMGDPEYAAEVVRMTVRNTRLPVSVKLRAMNKGEDPGRMRDFVQGLESAGALWLTLHPRTAEQKRRGCADWSQIAEIRKFLRIPVIGNGDIQTSEDVHRMLAQTGCEMVMSGRALAARPWMLWQLGEELGWPPPEGRSGHAPRGREEEGAEYGRALLDLIEASEKLFSVDLALRKLRFYIRTTHVWLVFGHELMALSSRCNSTQELKMRVREFFQHPQEMVPRTELRQ